MLTKRLKPGQLFTANGKVFRVRNAKSDCDECIAANNNRISYSYSTIFCVSYTFCIAGAGKFDCLKVCGIGHYPQFIRNAK